MQRRFILKSILSLILTPISALANVWNKAAFEATKVEDANSALTINSETPSNKIEIIAPEKAENGAVVQVEVRVSMSEVEGIALFVEGNPTPLIANFILHKNTQPHIVTRIKMAQSSLLRAVVKVGNQYYSNTKQITVLEDGCGGTDSEAKFESSIKMRAKVLDQSDAQLEVKVIIVHPMTTGRAKNSSGELIPAHFIQTIEASLNNEPVMLMQAGTAIAKNPYLTFYLTKAKLGDQINVKWQDNLGYQGQAQAVAINK